MDDFACRNKTGACTSASHLRWTLLHSSHSFHTGDVGDLSCIGAESCQSSTGTIGDNSCLMEDGADEDSPPRSCINNTGSIGSGSCIGRVDFA